MSFSLQWSKHFLFDHNKHLLKNMFVNKSCVITTALIVHLDLLQNWNNTFDRCNNIWFVWIHLFNVCRREMRSALNSKIGNYWPQSSVHIPFVLVDCNLVSHFFFTQLLENHISSLYVGEHVKESEKEVLANGDKLRCWTQSKD